MAIYKIVINKVSGLPILFVLLLCSFNSLAAADITAVDNKSTIAIGAAGHWTEGGQAKGLYISGINSFYESNYGVYGRVEYISDEYKTGDFQSLNIAIGVAYTSSELTWITPYATIGKCYSSYLTCYFNDRNKEGESVSKDHSAIYFGGGGYIPLSVLPFDGFGVPGVLEIALDYSLYGGYGSKSLYLGYGINF